MPGAILRFPARHPLEVIAGLMLIDDATVDTGLLLIRVSGYHAGQMELRLPVEALGEGILGVATQLLRENWTQWIHTHSHAQDAWISEHYPAHKNLPGSAARTQ
jgi:hypothetical protein